MDAERGLRPDLLAAVGVAARLGVLSCALAAAVPLSAQEPIGPRLRPHSVPDGSQYGTAVAAVPGGGFLVLWHDQAVDPQGLRYSIVRQGYGADGVPEGGNTVVNAELRRDQVRPAIAVADDGGYLVAWDSYDFDSALRRVKVRAFDASGSPRTPEILASSETCDLRLTGRAQISQIRPAVAVVRGAGAQAGRFVVVWEQVSEESPGFLRSDVYARLFDADAGCVGQAFQVNATVAGDQQRPAVTAFDDGGFAVVWDSYGQPPTSLRGIYARWFGPDAMGVSEEVQVPEDPQPAQCCVAVGQLRDGGVTRLLFAWDEEEEGTLRRSVHGRVFEASGQPAGGAFRISPAVSAGHDGYPAVAAAAQGTTVVGWEHHGGPEGEDRDVHGQLVDAGGQLVGGRFCVTGGTAGDGGFDQERPAVAVDGDRFVVGWRSWAEDGDEFGVYAQRFDLDPDPSSDGCP